MNAGEYLTILTEQIRCKKARGSVQAEMQNHIDDQKDFFVQQDIDPSEAEVLAVKEMGDPVAVGIDLDLIHRPRMAWGMIGLIVVLSLVGFAVQYLLQMNFSESTFFPEHDRYYFIYMLVGLLVMTGVCYLDYSWIGHWAREITVILLVIFYIWIIFLFPSVSRLWVWIRIGGIYLDIRMLLFLFVPLYGGILYRYRGEGYQALAKSILWMIPALYLALLCSSMSTMIMLGLAFIITLSVAVWKNWFQVAVKRTLLAIGTGVLLMPVIFGCLLLQFGKAYQIMRVRAMVDVTVEAAFQLRIVRELIAGSSLIGSNGMQMESLLASSNYYVLTYLISCYGILAAAFLIGLMGVLFLCLLNVSLKQKNKLGMIMGAGCAAALFVQVLFYILVNIGAFMTFSYCPFISSGTTGILVTDILLGILLSIYRYQNVLSDSYGPQKRTKKQQIRIEIDKKRLMRL